jgi:hypothetical protein
MNIKIKKTESKVTDPNNGHGAPTSRRDFISRSAGFGMLTMIAPTILTQFAKGAIAQGVANCPSPARPNTIPLYVIDLAGGYSVAANFIPKNQAGEYLASYRTHGVVNENHPSIKGGDTSIGLEMHKSSGFLDGLLSTTTDAVRQKVDAGLFCISSADDSSSNQFSIAYVAAAAGAVGTLIPTMGSSGTISGGRQAANPAYYRSQHRPVVIGSVADALALANYGNLTANVGIKGAERVSRAIASMSSSALNRFSDQVISKQLKDLVSCAYSDQAKLPLENTAATIDPRLNPSITSAFNNIGGNGNQARFATAVSLVSSGLAGQAVLTLGGYDYHGNTVAQQVAKDREVGDLVGRILAAHANLAIPAVVLVVSDGSTSSGGGAAIEATAGLPSTGNAQQTSDNGNQGGAVMFAYNPAATRAQTAITRKRQAGWFRNNSLTNSNTGVDTRSSAIANDVPRASIAFVANYLALMGREGELARILGGSSPLSSSQLDEVLLFNKIT